jgi:glyoxylase-like metal-dependent hydrolase (beta-lactamase superfamily II)/rhodanese-related sulfurtransferase
MDPVALHDALEGPAPPLVLDVRNEDEFARWRVESRRAVETLNVPYFGFIEDEEQSVARVRAWADRRGGAARGIAVVCAKGCSSEFVTGVLAGHGFAAQSVDGGMAAWGRASVCRPVAARSVRAWQVQRFGKGCLSYLLAAGDDAVVVDPHRDTAFYQRLLDERRLRLRAVVDTHLHADHVSGGRALADAAGADYRANPADFEGAQFAYESVADGARIRAGKLELTPLVVLHTPGHTPGSTSLAVADELLLTGDTLFVGSVGRPDLAGHAAEWARDLWDSLHRRLARIGDAALVLPAHTAGAAEARDDGVVAGELGTLRRDNAAMRSAQDEFVRVAATSLPPAPAEYARIRAINLAPQTASGDELDVVELGKNQCAMAPKAP